VPSVFTPFFRRFFGTEVDREMRDLRQRYAEVAECQRLHGRDKEQLVAKVMSYCYEVPQLLHDPIEKCLRTILDAEDMMFSMPPLRSSMTLIEQTRLSNLLARKKTYFDRQKEFDDKLLEALVPALTGIGEALPEMQAPSPFTIPLIYALANPKTWVSQIITHFYDRDYDDRGLFTGLIKAYTDNIYAVSGTTPDGTKPLIFPEEAKLPLNELTERYLRGTPFLDLYQTPVPLKLSYRERYTHWHAVGGTGAGKTSLLETLIFNDLKTDDPPSIVVIDSQGDLINRLTKLEIFSQVMGEKFYDKVVLITPKDVKHPPAINIFDVKRLDAYDEVTQEQVLAGVLQTFDYLFDGLLGADLSAKQGVFFRMVARLMLSLPKTMGRPATILDMMQLMDDPTPYLPAIRSLPRIPREFFERDFLRPKSIFQKTREEVRYRLQAVIDTPAFERLFTAPSTKVDFFDLLNKGSVVLIDTAKDFLKDDSGKYGRVMISLILQAIMERAALPREQRKPTFIFIDECHEYFDDTIDDFLTEVRKHNCGIVLGHQYLDQASHKLRASLAANTGIKFASKVSISDARAMAPDMRTTPDFILDQPDLHFAAHIRNVTPAAVSIPITPGLLDREPKVSDNAYHYFRAANQFRISLSSSDAIVRDLRRARGEEVEEPVTHKVEEPSEQVVTAPADLAEPRMTKNARKRAQRKQSTDDGQEFSDEW
jgi:hypothetical protein